MLGQLPLALARPDRDPDLDALAEPEEGLAEEVPEDGHGHGDGRQAAGVAAAQVAEDGGCLVDGAGDELGIRAVRGVPVAAVEDADGVIVVRRGQRAEETYETDFVVDLRMTKISN